MKAAQFEGDALWQMSWRHGDGEETLRFRTKRPRHEAELTLYSSWFCPFAQRAWIACEEKCVDYHWVEVNPYAVDPKEPGGYTKKQLPIEIKQAMYPQFVAASPKGLVPAIDCCGEKLCESQPIIEYIDGKFKERGAQLCPDDPFERALCRVWADYADQRIQRPYYRMLVEQSAQARQAAYADMVAGCKDFARAMAPLERGPFFRGAHFSYTDVSFAPFFWRILLVGKHYRDIELPDDDPDIRRLMEWWRAVKARGSVAKTLVCEERLIASYSNYAENKATSDYAKSLMSSLSATTRNSSALAKISPRDRTRMLPFVLIAFLAGIAVGSRRLW